MEDKLAEHEKRIKELEERPIGSGGGADLREINKLLEDFLKKNEFEDYLKRLEKCEKKAKKAKDMAKKCHKKLKEKVKPKIKHMEKDIEELKEMMKNKLDISIFDEEMERLKSIINSLNSSGGDPKPLIPAGPSLSTKEITDIREAIKKVWEHEEKLKDLSLDHILKKLHELEKELKEKADEKDVKKLDKEKANKKKTKEKLKKLNEEIEELKKLLKKLEATVKTLSEMGAGKGSGVGADVIIKIT